jgi:hypothetical protein
MTLWADTEEQGIVTSLSLRLARLTLASMATAALYAFITFLTEVQVSGSSATQSSMQVPSESNIESHVSLLEQEDDQGHAMVDSVLHSKE